MPGIATTEIGSTPVTADVDDFQTGRVLTVSAAHAVHDTYTAFLPSMLPVFIANLALSKTEAGLLTVFIGGSSVLQPFIGHLADRISLRYLVILAPAATAAIMSLSGIAPSYAVLAVLLVLAGVSSACMHSVGPVMAGRLSGQRLGRGMGLWMVGGEVGRTLGPIVIVSAFQILTPQGTPWLMVAGVSMSILLLVLLRDVAGRPPGAAEALRWGEALGALGPLLVPLIGIIIGRSFMVSALTTYLPTFLSDEGAGLFFAGASLSILEGAGVIGALLGGSLSDRLGRRTVLISSMLATSLLMFAFLAVDGWLHIPLLLLLGLSALSAGPVMMALAQESLPESRALANGLYGALSFMLRSGVVVVIGAIGDWLDLRSAFAVSAAAPLLVIPLILFLPLKRSQ